MFSVVGTSEADEVVERVNKLDKSDSCMERQLLCATVGAQLQVIVIVVLGHPASVTVAVECGDVLLTTRAEHSENLSGFVLVDKERELEVGTSGKVLGNTELLLCHRVHATGDVEREWLVEHNRPLSSNTLLAAFATDTCKRECFASNTTASKDAEMLNPSTVVNQNTAFVVLNITQQLNIKIRSGTMAKSNTDTEGVQEYLVLVAQHKGAWLKNMTKAFDSDDFLESISALWSAHEVHTRSGACADRAAPQPQLPCWRAVCC